MGKVVKDFKGEKETRGRDALVPVEDGLVDDFHFAGVSPRGRVFHDLGVLYRCQLGGNFNDFVICPGVDVWIYIADVVEDVEHQRAAAGTHFVDYQVMVRVGGKLVVGDEVAGDGFAVVGAEELGRGVPELAGVGGFFCVESVFEFYVALGEEGVKV